MFTGRGKVEDFVNMRAPIKILHLTWSADKAGMLTDIVSIQSRDPSLQLDVCFGTREKGVFAEQMEQIGIHPRIIGMRSRYSPIENIKGGLRLRRIIREGKYNIIHLQEAMIPFPFLASVSFSRAKIVIHSRGEFNITETFRQRICQVLKGVVYRLLVPGRVDRIICNSRFTLGKMPLAPRFIPKVEVLYNAIDLERIRRIRENREELRKKLCREQVLAGDACIVTVVARLVEFKRIDRFIRAFSTAARENPHLTSFIVGDGPLRERLEREVSTLGLVGRIRLLGYRPDAKEITASSDLFVLPSAGEAFGIAALEAVALQTPVAVFADVGGPLEFIREGMNGYVVADEAELARRIIRFGRGETILKSSVEEEAVCDINGYARRIRRIYDELLDRAAPQG
jgi:glycosyltransferase involved in cell wall biosynthesis